MFITVVSSMLLTSLVQGASHYGGVPVVQPDRQVAAPSIQCRTEYVTLWDTEYPEKEEQICATVYEKQCRTRQQRLCQPTSRQECRTEYEQQCATVYKNVCVEQYKTEYEPYTESECTTEYKQDCQYQWEGEGNDKVWAPIQGTCQNVPYDQCQDVAKTHAKQVTYEACHKEPEQNCVSVPKEVCVTVPDQVCKNEPLRKCQELPREICHAEHRRYPIRVSRSVPKKTCGGVQVVQPAFPEAPQVGGKSTNKKLTTV
jgi:hypothetical protein